MPARPDARGLRRDIIAAICAGVKVCFWYRLRTWSVVILLGLGMALANLASKATADGLPTLDPVVMPTDGCNGSHGSGHAGNCLPVCGTYCQALLPGQIEAPPPRRRHFDSVAEQAVGDCIGYPEPHPPKILSG